MSEVRMALHGFNCLLVLHQQEMQLHDFIGRGHRESEGEGMRFRILTNGEKYRVQRKGFIRWGWEGRIDGCYDQSWLVPHEFNSDGEAVQFIKETYGTEAEIDRPWVASA